MTLLQPTNDLIHAAFRGLHDRAFGDADDQPVVARKVVILRSITLFAIGQRMPIHPVTLDGDAVFGEGEVHDVGAECVLRYRLQSSAAEHRVDCSFQAADSRHRLLGQNTVAAPRTRTKAADKGRLHVNDGAANAALHRHLGLPQGMSHAHDCSCRITLGAPSRTVSNIQVPRRALECHKAIFALFGNPFLRDGILIRRIRASARAVFASHIFAGDSKDPATGGACALWFGLLGVLRPRFDGTTQRTESLTRGGDGSELSPARLAMANLGAAFRFVAACAATVTCPSSSHKGLLANQTDRIGFFRRVAFSRPITSLRAKLARFDIVIGAERYATSLAVLFNWRAILIGHSLTSNTGRGCHVAGVFDPLAATSLCPNYTVGAGKMRMPFTVQKPLRDILAGREALAAD